MGCVKGKAVWKIVESVCQGVKQEDFRRHSENLRDRNFKGEDRNGTDKSDLNSLKYHRVKKGMKMLSLFLYQVNYVLTRSLFQVALGTFQDTKSWPNLGSIACHGRSRGREVLQKRLAH